MTSAARELASELRTDILSAKTVPALSAGFTSGLGLLVAQVAFGSRRAALLEHAADDLDRHLQRQIRFEDLMEALRDWLTPRDYAADEAVAGADAPREGLQLLLSGRASAYDGAGARLYQLGPGDAIWPAGAPGARATSVVADEPCRTMVLTAAARRRLEEREERLALELYRYLLAEPLGTGAEEELP